MKNKSQKIPTITIAICALNEGSNIGDLMKSLLIQKEEGYILEKILIISDGSTDNTVDILKSFKNEKIVIHDYKQRVGKSVRLNEIYTETTSDIVVQPDADVILSHPFVIRDVIKAFENDSSIGMVGGNAQPMTAETFTERAVNYTLEVYIPFRKSLKGGHNILSATGRLLAVRKQLFRQITVPKDTIANDGFVYFCAITKGFSYRYAESAVVYFRSPQNLKDHINQNTRFLSTPKWMKKYFPPEVVDTEYHIPADLIKPEMVKQLKKHPIHCLYIFLINKYCLLRAYILKNKINALWEIVYSTKKLKQYDK